MKANLRTRSARLLDGAGGVLVRTYIKAIGLGD